MNEGAAEMSRRTPSLLTAAALSLAVAAGAAACGSSHPSVAAQVTPRFSKPSPTLTGPQYKAVDNVCTLLSNQVASTYIAIPEIAVKDHHSYSSETMGYCSWKTPLKPGEKVPRDEGDIDVTIHWCLNDPYGATGAQLAHNLYNGPSWAQSVNTTPYPGRFQSRWLIGDSDVM